MKYIRTKDGIFERMFPDCETQRISFDHKTIEPAYFTINYDWVAQKDVIKQADTIEELCDRYYGVDENGDVCRVHNWSKDCYPSKPHEWAVDGFCTKKDITISELKKLFPKGIFGAVVWFDDNGNLHIDIVAKMNDKGELELL